MAKHLLLGAIFILSVIPLSAAEPKRTYENAVTADALPSGYEMTRQVVGEGQTQATMLSIEKKNSSARALIVVGSIKLPTDETKARWIKAAMGGVKKSFAKSEVKVLKMDAEELSSADFSKPYLVNMTCETKSGDKRKQYIRFFFADVAYQVTVVGSNQTEFNRLKRWADSVTEKESN